MNNIEKLAGSLKLPVERLGQNFILKISSEKIRETIETIQESINPRFIMLAAEDFGEKYIFHYFFSAKSNTIEIRTSIRKKTNKIDSVKDIFPLAEFAEIECHELYGIRFGDNDNSGKVVIGVDIESPMKGMKDRPQPKYMDVLISTGCTLKLTGSVKKSRSRIGLDPEPAKSEENIVGKIKEAMEND